MRTSIAPRLSTHAGEYLPRNFASARSLAALATIGLAAIGAGWLIAHGHAIAIAAVVVLGVLLVLAVKAPASLAALLLLAVLNGVPVLDLSGRLPGGLKFQDAAVLALAVLIFAYQDRAPPAERMRIIRAAMIWSACLLGWWVFTFARSVLLDGVPVLKAALFGRDFLYFAILLPLALRARFPARSVRAGARLLFYVVIADALGQGLESVTGLSVGWLAHPATVDTSLGINRLYSSMAYIINTGLIFAGALFLSREGRGRRWLLGALVALFIVDAAVELTRANYFSLAVAILVGISFYARRYGTLTAVLIRVAFVIPVVITGVIATSNIAGNDHVSVVDTLVARATSGVSAVVRSTGTVAYREQVDREMLHVLGTKWPVGLGFLHPSAHYVSGVPDGTIRNADTGVFNALMTMGIVGVLLIYAPLAYAMRELLRASGTMLRGTLSFPRWIFFGGAAWIAWALAGSPTLILLFSIPGVVLTALTVAALAQVTTQAHSVVRE